MGSRSSITTGSPREPVDRGAGDRPRRARDGGVVGSSRSWPTRVRAFLAGLGSGSYERRKIFWRDDRIERILARDYHPWFAGEIAWCGRGSVSRRRESLDGAIGRTVRARHAGAVGARDFETRGRARWQNWSP